MGTERATAVEARGVVRRYGGITALADLDLALAAGSVTTILGPNGAGKTTFVALTLGQLQPDSGAVSVFGHRPGTLAARRLTGAMLQAAGLAPQLTVGEHVKLHTGYYPDARPAAESLDLAGLDAVVERRYEALSGGQQRRVQFALAICGRPRFLVLDEPTVAMDPESRRALWNAVRQLADEGAAVLLTTHQLEEAEALSDRVVLLAAGRLLADGTPAEIRARVAARLVRCSTHVPLAQLRTLPGVTDALPLGRHVAIRTQAAEATLRALFELDPTLADLEVTGMSLEDAVLDLLRAEAA